LNAPSSWTPKKDPKNPRKRTHDGTGPADGPGPNTEASRSRNVGFKGINTIKTEEVHSQGLGAQQQIIAKSAIKMEVVEVGPIFHAPSSGFMPLTLYFHTPLFQPVFLNPAVGETTPPLVIGIPVTVSTADLSP
jgi:hypothetical protein